MGSEESYRLMIMHEGLSCVHVSIVLLGIVVIVFDFRMPLKRKK